MKQLLILPYLMMLLSNVHAQTISNTKQMAKPKIVVGIVIDQMRWDYLERFQSRYSTGGFKKMIRGGYNFQNTYLPYVPSYTAVGHSCIYTGSVPAIDGIVGNNWWEKSINSNMYCTSDSTVQSVGGSDYAGKMSPKNLWVSTIGDELRLSTNFESKVIGISLKDRGAILPAGHAANAAYWYDDRAGKWISSTYYMSALPAWVQSFNGKDEPGTLMTKDWNTLYPITTYTQSTADDMPYENIFPGISSPVFPYKTSVIRGEKYSAFKYTPSAMTYTFDFAKAAIENEGMGSGKATDFLALSISSTDYIGHAFGPNSIEMEDTYLRLDKDLESFFTYLDKKFGAGNYLAFLTADHGAAHVPAFLTSHQIPAGTYNEIILEKELNDTIKKVFGVDRAIVSSQNYQLYLNDAAIAAKKINGSDINDFIISILLQKPYITQAYATGEMYKANIPQPIREMLINGFERSRSGDIQFLLKPGYFDGGPKGTTHGLWNPYDTHIPLLFYGWHIKPGSTFRETYMTDIAPTLAALLHIQVPNGSVGKVLTEITQ